MTALRAVLLSACVALLAACGQGSATPGNTTALTEANVRELIEKVEASSYTDQEREVMDPALSDDFRVTFHSPGQPDESMDKQEYAQDVEGMEDVQYAYKIGKVRVAPDGKSATVDLSISEAFEDEGTLYASTADQVYRVELRNGHPMIVALESNETSFSIDGEKQY